jgi:hypothetical protein
MLNIHYYYTILRNLMKCLMVRIDWEIVFDFWYDAIER